MDKNYQIFENDNPLDPPEYFNEYSEGVNWMSRYYSSLRKSGKVVTPIINGKFTCYEVGEDDEMGSTFEIVMVHDG